MPFSGNVPLETKEVGKEAQPGGQRFSARSKKKSIKGLVQTSKERVSRLGKMAVFTSLKRGHAGAAKIPQSFGRHLIGEVALDVLQSAADHEGKISLLCLAPKAIPVEIGCGAKNGQCVRNPSDGRRTNSVSADMKELIGWVEDSNPVTAENRFAGSGPEVFIDRRAETVSEQIPVKVQIPSQGVEQVSRMSILE